MPPANPRQLLHFHRSDGDSSQWPVSNPPEWNAESYDWFEPLGPKDLKTLLYTVSIGQAIDEAYNIAERAGKRPAGMNGPQYEMYNLPEGYKVFNHHKKKGHGDKERVDAYLFGGLKGHRFRSPNEFKAHAIALAMDDDGTPYFDVEPFTSGLTDTIKVMAVDLPKHIGCKLCDQKLAATGTRTTKPRVGPSGRSKRSKVEEEATQIVNEEERERARTDPGFNLRRGELVWVLDPATSDRIKSTPSLAPANIPDRVYYSGSIIEIPKHFLPLEKFLSGQVDNKFDGMYTVQIMNADGVDDKNGVKIYAHLMNVFPKVLFPELRLIDERSHIGSILPTSSASFIVQQAHNADDDMVHNLSGDGPLGYASLPYQDSNFQIFDGLYAGAEKIWQDDIVQISDPHAGSNSSNENPFRYMQAKDFVLEVANEDQDPDDGYYTREMRVKLAGPTYTPGDRTIGPYTGNATMPQYFQHEQLREQDLQASTLDLYQCRYYEPEALNFWTNRHNLTFTPMGITNVVPDRRDSLFPGDFDQLEGADTADSIAKAGPSHAFAAINTPFDDEDSHHAIFTPAEQDVLSSANKQKGKQRADALERVEISLDSESDDEYDPNHIVILEPEGPVIYKRPRLH